MIEIEKALRLILGGVRPLPEETVPLSRAHGRVLARALRARTSLPSFDNSTMDGYAVRADDLPKTPAFLPVSETIRAGAAGSALPRGSAAKIMTGAAIPKGADSVVMKEWSEPKNGLVEFLRAPEPGDWIRRAGEDVRAGEGLLEAGTRLRPYEIALLAAQGIASVPVHRSPRAGVVSTGDELVASESPRPGKIRDANGPAILSALDLWGFSGSSLGIVPDEPARLKKAFAAGLARADALIVSGGVSVGDFDLTKSLLESLGVRIVFWKVKIKPGKPLLFGLSRDGQPVFGLPGNPISVLVCLEEFVRPALERMSGLEPQDRYLLEGRAANAFELPRERRQLLFCAASRSAKGYSLKILRPQASHMMARCARANALARPARGVRRVRPGDKLPFRLLD